MTRKEVILVKGEEPLVDVADFCPKVFTCRDKPQFLRLGVAERLNLAVDHLDQLSPDLALFLNSGWRSVTEQEDEFWRVFNSLERGNPAWTVEKLRAEADKYVAPSSGPDASGHLTGGAIDLVLAFRGTGNKVPMICSNLTFQENTKTFQPKLSFFVREYRWIMFCAMVKVGFANVKHEYWHWSYGDRSWAEITGQPAIYGIIKEL